MIHRQRGITLLGFIIILSLVVFFGYIGIRLLPIYQEYFSVVQSMKTVAAKPDAPTMSPGEVRGALQKSLDVNYIESVGRQNVFVTRDSNGYNLRVAYEVRTPLIFNLDVVAYFDETVELLGR